MDFPVGPAVKTPYFHCRWHGLIPGRGKFHMLWGMRRPPTPHQERMHHCNGLNACPPNSYIEILMLYGMIFKDGTSERCLLLGHEDRTLINQSHALWASLVAQWLRIRLPMQGTRARALVQKDPICRGTKPVRHNHWAQVPQLLKPVCLEPVLCKRSHRTATKSSPRSLQLEKARVQQRRCNAAKINK